MKRYKILHIPSGQYVMTGLGNPYSVSSKTHFEKWFTYIASSDDAWDSLNKDIPMYPSIEEFELVKEEDNEQI